MLCLPINSSGLYPSTRSTGSLMKVMTLSASVIDVDMVRASGVTDLTVGTPGTSVNVRSTVSGNLEYLASGFEFDNASTNLTLINPTETGGEFTDEWTARFESLLRLLMEPSLEPYYRALAPKFFNRFLPAAVSA